MKTFIISDTHFPFHNKKAFKEMLSHIREEKPTHVIQIGDLLDQYIFSKYSRSLGITSTTDIETGLNDAVEMWEEIRRLVPRAKCFQLLGNHDVRMSKRIYEKLPEMGEFFSHKNLYKFDGITMMGSDRDYLVLDGVYYVHGWLSKSIDHARYFNAPCVHGHRHRPAIEFDRKSLWSMDVGFLADESSLPLQYTLNKFSKWTMACGVVENKKPKLIIL